MLLEGVLVLRWWPLPAFGGAVQTWYEVASTRLTRVW